MLEQELSAYRNEPYDDLVRRIPGGVLAYERMAPSGAAYQVEIDFCWDGQPGGNVLVIGSIDDGRGWRAFAPLNRSFIKAADGSK